MRVVAVAQDHGAQLRSEAQDRDQTSGRQAHSHEEVPYFRRGSRRITPSRHDIARPGIEVPQLYGASVFRLFTATTCRRHTNRRRSRSRSLLALDDDAHEPEEVTYFPAAPTFRATFISPAASVM
jgi:hypothetical protein